MRRDRGPGRGASHRHRSEQTNNVHLYRRNPNQSLAVEPPSAAEQDFLAKVMRRLPGLPEPHIVVLLNTPRHPVGDDAQRLANERGEPVAIVNTEVELLAYRMPQRP
jgi:hypothetical protein